MKKLSNRQKLEMLIGKGVLFLVELSILFILFILGLHLLSWLINIMLNNFWFTMVLVVFDLILIFNELRKI